MAMRPIWAVVVTAAAVAVWWWLRTLAGGWVTFLFVYSGLALVLLAPVVMALFLVRRRRVGRRTSVAFGAQAGVLVLAGLLTPDSADNGPMVPLAVLLGHQQVSDASSGVLTIVGLALAVVWLLLIPIIGVLAWGVESKPAAVA